MAQGLLALGVSVANRPSAELQNALLRQIPFKKFVANFAKIWKKKQFSCVFVRFGKNFADFELLWSWKLLSCMGVPVSGGFRWVPVKSLFQSNFGIVRTISGGFLLLTCCRELRICHFPPKKDQVHPKKHQTENLTFFRVASFRIPEIWACRSMGSGVRVREVLQMQANRSPARSLPNAPMPNVKSFDRCLSRKNQEVMEETELSCDHATKRCFC